MKDKRSRLIHRISRQFFSTRPVAWLLSHVAHRLDRFLLRVTNGRYSAARLLTGVPVITLTTIGAKSGQPRTVPLLGIPDDGSIILIASNWGQDHHPAWAYNIRANPRVQVTVGEEDLEFTAHETSGGQRQRCWQKAVQSYPGYTAYEKWTPGREIPVFLLERIESVH